MMKEKKEYKSYQGKRPMSRGKKLLTALLALILTGVLAFCILLGVVLAGGHDEIHGDPTVMIILGCQLREDGPSVLLQDRLEEALDYLADHPDMTVVVSGGQGPGEPTTEARGMADYLIVHGVPEDQILLEDQSRNTSQNLAYSKQLLEESKVDWEGRVLVVSNGFHLSRIRLLARRQGLGEVSTLAAPTSDFAARVEMYIREPQALVKSFLFDTQFAV